MQHSRSTRARLPERWYVTCRTGRIRTSRVPFSPPLEAVIRWPAAFCFAGARVFQRLCASFPLPVVVLPTCAGFWPCLLPVSHQSLSGFPPVRRILLEGADRDDAGRSAMISVRVHFQRPSSFGESPYGVPVLPWLSAQPDVLPGCELPGAYPVACLEWCLMHDRCFRLRNHDDADPPR